MIISKPHAYLQRMVKTSVKFQKNRSKTVGGVAHTRYILYRGAKGKTDGRNDGKPKTISLRFSSKRRGTITLQSIRGWKTNPRIRIFNEHGRLHNFLSVV